MNADDVTAVVLNWRTPELTIRAVRALVSDGFPATRIVVVDNASRDDSATRFRRELPDSSVIALEQNVGFARANNVAASSLPARAGYLLVNSDAFVHAPGTVARMLAALADPRVGVIVPRLLNEDLSLQPSVLPLSTPFPEIVRASGLSRFVPNRLQPALGTHWDHSYSSTIQAANGAVLLLRARAWDELGGFDERTFMYTEDLDLFWRLALLGWSAVFLADAEFVHLGGASAQQRWGDATRARRIAAAATEMAYGHMPPGRARVTVAAMAAGAGVRAVIFKSLGRHSDAQVQAAWFRGYVSGSSE